MKRQILALAALGISTVLGGLPSAEAAQMDVIKIREDFTSLRKTVSQITENLDRDTGAWVSLSSDGITDTYSLANRNLLVDAHAMSVALVSDMTPPEGAMDPMGLARLRMQLASDWLQAANLHGNPDFVRLANRELEKAESALAGVSTTMTSTTTTIVTPVPETTPDSRPARPEPADGM